jgi:subtilisin family serine protease
MGFSSIAGSLSLQKAMKRLQAHPWRTRAFALVCGCALAGAAHAQLRVPSVSAPGLPPLPREPIAPVTQPVQQTLQALVPPLRAAAASELLRTHSEAVEADPAGEPIKRAQLLWLSPSASAVAAARAGGFAVLREENLPELDVHELVMGVPAGMPTAQAARRLRALDAGATVDFNHLYTRNGGVGGDASVATLPVRPAAARVGLIDGGVDRQHAALRRADVHGWGCDGRAIASEHGTAVASLLVGRDGAFHGVAAVPATSLYAADVYCDEPAGGAAEDIARALAWMAREHVPVVNISLVGPPNRLLETAVLAMVRRGHLLVAAVGNDGPAAAPLYPASYPGVVGVTGVLPDRRVLPEAAQGPQVMFAAPGAELAVARPGGWADARGTSFAAPFVAGLLAAMLRAPDPEGAATAVAELARSAIDLGAPGRDPVYGFGLVGEAARVAPAAVQARSR